MRFFPAFSLVSCIPLFFGGGVLLVSKNNSRNTNKLNMDKNALIVAQNGYIADGQSSGVHFRSTTSLLSSEQEEQEPSNEKKTTRALAPEDGNDENIFNVTEGSTSSPTITSQPTSSQAPTAPTFFPSTVPSIIGSLAPSLSSSNNTSEFNPSVTPSTVPTIAPSVSVTSNNTMQNYSSETPSFSPTISSMPSSSPTTSPAPTVKRVPLADSLPTRAPTYPTYSYYSGNENYPSGNDEQGTWKKTTAVPLLVTFCLAVAVIPMLWYFRDEIELKMDRVLNGGGGSDQDDDSLSDDSSGTSR